MDWGSGRRYEFSFSFLVFQHACSIVVCGRILSARKFWTRPLGFGNCGTMGWGKICRGSRPGVAPCLFTNSVLLIKDPITIQDGNIENLVWFQKNTHTASYIHLQSCWGVHSTFISFYSVNFTIHDVFKLICTRGAVIWWVVFTIIWSAIFS